MQTKKIVLSDTFFIFITDIVDSWVKGKKKDMSHETNL